MTVQLTDMQISDLEYEGRIIPCVRHVCAVCGQVVHDKPSADRHGRCPNGCRLASIPGVDCRLCGAPVGRTRGDALTCQPHRTYSRGEFPNGVFTMRLVDHHWHAAEGTGPVSQYAKTGE